MFKVLYLPKIPPMAILDAAKERLNSCLMLSIHVRRVNSLLPSLALSLSALALRLGGVEGLSV